MKISRVATGYFARQGKCQVKSQPSYQLVAESYFFHAQDEGQTDFNDILGDHSLKYCQSIDPILELCWFLLEIPLMLSNSIFSVTFPFPPISHRVLFSLATFFVTTTVIIIFLYLRGVIRIKCGWQNYFCKNHWKKLLILGYFLQKSKVAANSSLAVVRTPLQTCREAPLRHQEFIQLLQHFSLENRKKSDRARSGK